MSVPSPSSTVMLLRDSPQHGVEALLVRRNSNLATGGGAWVFPGGRVDARDYAVQERGGQDDEFFAAQNAAVRETLEETGLRLRREDLTAFAHWTTPAEQKRRFATWFFVAHLKEAVDVVVDGSEIVDFAWLTPKQALQAQGCGEIIMMPPTFVCLTLLARYQDCAEALCGFRESEVQRFNPKIVKTSSGQIILYDDDVGYATANPDVPGRHHRIVIEGKHWQYKF